jgi:2-oxoglutarate dehydrogenase E2 component (dihydrolipoamide succinyltransferase)
MSIAIQLPALGESVVEGTVARWLVREGDAVEIDQPVVEVTTDKVDAEIPSPATGVVEKILVQEGDTIAVGAELAWIAEGAPGVSPSRPAGSAPHAGAAPVESVVDGVVAPPSHAADLAAPGPRATPVAKRLAEDARLDLGDVEATGSGGRITKEDVLRHAAQQTAPTDTAPARAPQAQPVAQPAQQKSRPASTPPWAHYELQEGDQVIPMTPQRRLIAQHMVYSKQTSPHVGTVAEVDMGAVAELRGRHKQAFKDTHGISLTFLPFIVHAVMRALRDYPQLNASVIEDAIVLKQAISIGVAVETEKGLMVPVVRNADRLSLSGLAAAVDDLSSRARSKRISPDDLRGGTFTVSNPGRMGNLYGFAIINQPQVGILRMGEMVKRPVVRSMDGADAIVIRPMMHLALSYDHRAVDGQRANGFLYRIRELLEAAEYDL